MTGATTTTGTGGGRSTHGRRRVARALATVLVAGAAAVATAIPATGAAGRRPPRPSADAGLVQHRAIPASVAQLPLTDQSGATLTLASLRGKTVMLVPFLTLCSDICPMTTGNLVQVQHALAHDHAGGKVEIVELTVDPGRDDVARLAAYAKLTGATWDLVTEAPAELATIAAFFGFYYEVVPEDDPPDIDWMTGKPLTYDVTHSDGFALIDPSGHEVFANNAAPGFHGKLPARLRKFLSPEGVDHLRKAPKPDWTPAGALTALAWVVGRPLPARA